MNYLTIDTCVWLNLGCGNSNTELIDVLLSLISENEIKIILPELILDEWNRHKETKLIKNRIESIKGKLKNALQISEYLQAADKETFLQVLKNFESNKASIEKMALKYLDTIEQIFSHPSTIKLKITERHKLLSAERALSKKAPFRNKNSTADYLILFASIEYVNTTNSIPFTFITDNTSDFSSAEQKDSVHEDLYEMFSNSKICYSTNIGKALNDIKSNLVSQEIVNDIEQKKTYPSCPQCGRKMNGPLWLKYGNDSKPSLVCYQCDIFFDL